MFNTQTPFGCLRAWPRLARLFFCAAMCWLAGAVLASAQPISIAARSVQPGEVVRVEVAGPAELDGVVASVFSKRIPLEFDADRQVWNGLIGIDLNTKPGLYRLTIGKQVRLLRIAPKQFEVRRL